MIALFAIKTWHQYSGIEIKVPLHVYCHNCLDIYLISNFRKHKLNMKTMSSDKKTNVFKLKENKSKINFMETSAK